MTTRGPTTVMDDELRWSAVSCEQPCPVCGASAECGTAPFHGGIAVDCRNLTSSWPMVGGGWLHRLPPADADGGMHDAEGASCAFPVPPAIVRAPGPEIVLGAFEVRRMAERALDELLAAGFRADELSVVGRHGERVDLTPEHETLDKTMTGAGIGAAVGGGGAIALGLAAAAIPGIGPVVAFGPFAAALGGGFVGGLIGLFAAHGMPEQDATRYAERVRAGAFVVAVHTHDGLRAESILAQSGAEAPIRHTVAPPVSLPMS